MERGSPAPVHHLITELATGGAQSALLRLLERIDRTAWAPTVICYFNGDKPVAQAIRALGIDVVDLGMEGRASPVAFRRLHAWLRQTRPAILHTWMFHANVPGRIIGRMAGVPVIVSSERTMGQESRARRLLNRATAPLADRIICVSQNVADYGAQVIGLPAAKLVVIPNGVDVQMYRPHSLAAKAGAPLRFICVGRLERVKGVDLLLAAAALLRAALPGDTPAWSLTLVGDGAQRAELAAQAQVLGLADRVRFLGARQDVADLLSSHDVLVLPSRWEGMPNVALEAMACGLPVIATAVGGTPEVVVQNATGILVPSEQPLAFAQAMSVLLADSSLRARMGRAGRLRTEAEFSIDAAVARTEALYRELRGASL